MTAIPPENLASAEISDPYAHCRVVLEVLERIGNKWTVMVVGVLAQGPTRFNTIQRAIHGISHRMLTMTLRALERDGLVKRTAFATIPPKVEYELTHLGRSLIVPLQALGEWAMQHQTEIECARAQFDGDL
ncbi:transcriptional regulator [Pokkaliibacter plantistimulans]|uniref:Transcriptional regulator n=1 Tax=Proteobacteria bacterium 228 TaxID=2083153 RepID=A0A2S5KVJ3_9PROT|nr:helix-turn-helix domain-containing protein [Pokkaliibacter plantistimulans]PPC78733.1 transcriptional regulator [Pokkaliibacter plantistimulans]